ncbi:MAG: hypothetical protein ABI700_10175, partial [Chloroflexota bacterium]
MLPNTADKTLLDGKAHDIAPLRLDTQKTWLFLAPKLAGLLNFTALLTVAGFFVIQSYLASFSKLFTFNISVTQYVAAGVNLLLALFWNLFVPPLVYGIVLALGFVALYFVGRFCLSRNQRLHHLWTELVGRLRPLYKRIHPIIRATWLLYRVIAGGLYILLVISLALVYGTFYYAQSPRMFGGGMPADVILVFREDQP